MCRNYSEGDEKLIAILAAHSGVLDRTVSKIHELAELVKEEDLILGLGRSPTIFITMISIIYPNFNSVLLPFSGTPDTINIRDMTNNNDDNRRNIVTPDNLLVYNALLSKHLKNLKGKLYIVDHVGTASSLNSFLRIVRKLYPEALKNTFLLELGFDGKKKIESQAQVNGRTLGTFQYGPNSKKLALAGIAAIGTRKLTIDTIALGLGSRSLIMNDSPIVKYFLSPFAAFPPCNWTPYNLDEISKENQFTTRHLRIKNIFKSLYLDSN